MILYLYIYSYIYLFRHLFKGTYKWGDKEQLQGEHNTYHASVL